MTGRSLTTFKRDFKKAFNTTPQRWLMQKRLELAHYQLAEQKRKPVEICYEMSMTENRSQTRMKICELHMTVKKQ